MKVVLPSGLTIDVDYTYKDGNSDSYSIHGWMQGDSPEVEIRKTYLGDKEIQLSEKELEFIDAYIHEHHVSEYDGYRGDD